MSSKNKDARGQLMRLQAAVMLFVKQQCQRAMQGGQEDWEDLADENLRVVDRVLPILEDALDEDHAEALDDLQMPRFPRPFMPTMFKFPGFPGPGFPFVKACRRAMKEDGGVREILDDFRDDLCMEMRKARRHDHGLTDEELNKLLERLREELASLAKQTPRGRKEKAHEEA
jgi:hypothetical protein